MHNVWHFRAESSKFLLDMTPKRHATSRQRLMTSSVMSLILPFFKMADQAEIVQLYFELGKSITAVIRRMKKDHSIKEIPSRHQIRRIVKKFQQYGTVLDRRTDNTGRPRAARSADNVEQVRQIVEETPRSSVRKVLQDVSNVTPVSKSSVHRILRFDLKYLPYKIQLLQHLKENDISSRLTFADWALANDNVLDNVWFSDEAHFTLSGYVNKQNVRYWGTSKPEIYDENPLHSEKVTVWAAVNSTGVIGPFFFEEGTETVTVTSDRYLALLRNKFLPALSRKGVNLDECWFQQDGAAPHTSNIVLDFLTATFGEHLTAIEWPPHSPDLNPLDFFLWGHLKDKVYDQKPQCLIDLKAAIRREMKRVTSSTCQNVIDNFRRRMTLLKLKHGGHLEHVL